MLIFVITVIVANAQQIPSSYTPCGLNSVPRTPEIPSHLIPTMLLFRQAPTLLISRVGNYDTDQSHSWPEVTELVMAELGRNHSVTWQT